MWSVWRWCQCKMVSSFPDVHPFLIDKKNVPS
jgi:hypothetical protein